MVRNVMIVWIVNPQITQILQITEMIRDIVQNVPNFRKTNGGSSFLTHSIYLVTVRYFEPLNGKDEGRILNIKGM